MDFIVEFYFFALKSSIQRQSTHYYRQFPILDNKNYCHDIKLNTPSTHKKAAQ